MVSFSFNLVKSNSQISTCNSAEDELIEHYRQLLWAPQLSITTKQYILVSLAKISVRMEHCTA